jgi:hypothetical protein
MAQSSDGVIGRTSLVALLIAMEAKYYVLTSGSNWSRLIDELRKGVVDVDCGNCTVMIDLRRVIAITRVYYVYLICVPYANTCGDDMLYVHNMVPFAIVSSQH